MQLVARSSGSKQGGIILYDRLNRLSTRVCGIQTSHSEQQLAPGQALRANGPRVHSCGFFGIRRGPIPNISLLTLLIASVPAYKTAFHKGLG